MANGAPKPAPVDAGGLAGTLGVVAPPPAAAKTAKSSSSSGTGQPGATSPQVGMYTPTPTNPYSSPRTVYEPNTFAQNELQPGATQHVVTPELLKYLDALASFMGHNRTANGIWTKAVDTANREGTTVMDVVAKIADSVGFTPNGSPATGVGSKKSSGGGSGRAPAYNGPVSDTSFQPIGSGDLRSMADQLGMAMVGRGVTDAEFAKMQSAVSAKEKADPTVTTRTPVGHNTVTTSTGGVTNADRQDVIQNILAQNPQYGDYQKATTMMNWFDAALQSRMQANG